MDKYVSRIWFIIMMQLGFDPIKIEVTHKLRIHESMFRNANPRGLEVVIYFLLSKLDPNKARGQFKPCWPIQDKNEERQFRKLCIDWLNDLGASWPNLGITSIRKPSVILLNPIGDKVYRFLFNFGYCVFLTQINSFPQRIKNSIPNFPFPGNGCKPGLISQGAIRSSQAMTINNMQQFLWWLEQQYKSNNTWLTNSQEYCNQITILRKRNKEYQKLICEKSSLLSPGYCIPKIIVECAIPQLISNIGTLSHQMSQLTKSFVKFSLFCDNLKSSLSIGGKRRIIDGNQLEIKMNDPILSSYEKLYRNGRIGAIYSDTNAVCFGSFLQLGKLSLVTTEDLMCRSNIIVSLFDKSYRKLDIVDTANSRIVSILDLLHSGMKTVKNEPRNIEHYRNKVKIMEFELMNSDSEGSKLSSLLNPPNLTDLFDKMMAELFDPTINQLILYDLSKSSLHKKTQSIISDQPQSITTQVSKNSYHYETNKLTLPILDDTNGAVTHTSIDSLYFTKPTLSNVRANKLIEIGDKEIASIFHDKSQKKARQQSSINIIEESNEKVRVRKVAKRRDQIVDDLLDKISTVMMSNDPIETEPQYFDDPIEALDEFSAFQSKDNITRTPDGNIFPNPDSIKLKDCEELKSQLYTFATQSHDSQYTEFGNKSDTHLLPFLSPLKDDDLT